MRRFSRKQAHLRVSFHLGISSRSVALNKATDVGCFTVWGVAQIGEP